MSRFRVTAHMKAPLVLGGGYFTLDGLLGALLFDRLDGPPAACNRMKQEGAEASAVSYRSSNRMKQEGAEASAVSYRGKRKARR